MSDEILIYIKDSVTRIEANQKDADKRIRDVEDWQNNANGKISMVGLFGVTIGGSIMAAIEWFRGH